MARLTVKDRQAGDIGGKQIIGALHTLEIQPKHRRQRRRQGRLATAGRVLDQKMPVGKKTAKRQPHRRLAPQKACCHCGDHGIRPRRHIAGGHATGGHAAGGHSAGGHSAGGHGGNFRPR